MTVQTTTRNASLEDLAALLQDQQNRKVDVVAPAATLRSLGGTFHVKGAEAQITEDGVTTVDGRYQPTRLFDGQLAEKLGIPPKYLHTLRESGRTDLYDANVNGLLLGVGPTVQDGSVQFTKNAETDQRKFLFRGFTDSSGGVGVARALLSQNYGIVDHLDVLFAVLDGIRQSGVEVKVTGADLTDRKLYVKVSAPSVAALAPELLKGYRSPFSGLTGADNPTVFAGFVVSNSETGGGAFSVTPRLEVQICTNGLTITKDALRSIHLGGKLDEGIVRWSEDTQRKNLEVVTAKARDAVATFLDVDYVKATIAGLEAEAGVPVNDAAATIEKVSKSLAFTQEQQAGILDHFIKGGQLTAGGVLQAVTSFAQTIEDADAAYEFEAAGLPALSAAVAAQR